MNIGLSLESVLKYIEIIRIMLDMILHN